MRPTVFPPPDIALQGSGHVAMRIDIGIGEPKFSKLFDEFAGKVELSLRAWRGFPVFVRGGVNLDVFGKSVDQGGCFQNLMGIIEVFRHHFLPCCFGITDILSRAEGDQTSISRISIVFYLDTQAF
jgi:hypothetical protein